jgi:hypothetical protein
MRVFVVGTGRCGSMTFARAARHMTNYTAAHESPIPADLRFPDGHVEVSPRLTWLLPSLVEIYPADTLYVHLRRKKEEVVRSWLHRGRHRGPGIWERLVYATAPQDFRQTCELCYDAMTRLIETSLAGRNRMTLWLHRAPESWGRFWRAIGSQGDYPRSLAEWTVRHNASRP